MSNYSTPKPHYRKIYEDNFGPIPVDDNGRTYDIHHIDGNHSNNEPTNLKAVSIQEHYDIHFSQGDWYACSMIALRMSKTPAEISAEIRENNRKMFDEGHIWQDREWARERTRKRLENGTHNFQGPHLQKKRIAEGRHPFIGELNPTRQKIKDGTHLFLVDNPNEETVTCPNCGVSGARPGMIRWHFDNCSIVSSSNMLTCNVCGKTGRGGSMFRHHFQNCRHFSIVERRALCEQAKTEKKQQKLELSLQKKAQQLLERQQKQEQKRLHKIQKEEQRLASLKKPQFRCCYCNKITDSANLKRWHGNNCKLRPSLIAS